jgi:glucose-6-phosphate isomerase
LGRGAPACLSHPIFPSFHKHTKTTPSAPPTDKVRNGEWVGVSGKPLTNVIAIGIGGSYLGPAFIHTALQFDQECKNSAGTRRLRFLANVDPVDVAKSINLLDPEETLVSDGAQHACI